MIQLYCNAFHSESVDICEQCGDLESYALARIDKCPFGNSKPSCSKCEIHCYEDNMREKIKIVMRYSGPRMIIFHPLYALVHILVTILPYKTALNTKRCSHDES